MSSKNKGSPCSKRDWRGTSEYYLISEQESKQERMGVYAISAKAEDFEGQTIG